MDIEVLSWNDIYRHSIKLAEKMLDENYIPDVVVGVMRGGWVPARIVIDLLDVKTLATLEIKFYKGIGETREKPVITQPLVVNVRDKNVLVVDDVVDTGKSMSVAVDAIRLYGPKKIKTASIALKPWSIFSPDYYSYVTSSWIVFPWEVRETLQLILKKPEGMRELENVARKITELSLIHI